MTDRPPLPPFDRASALTKVQAAEGVAGAYTVDSAWRNRDAFFTGRPAIIEFLTAKWNRELDYALRKNLWAFGGNRICGPVPVRVPRRAGPVVALLRQRAMGV